MKLTNIIKFIPTVSDKGEMYYQSNIPVNDDLRAKGYGLAAIWEADSSGKAMGYLWELRYLCYHVGYFSTVEEAIVYFDEHTDIHKSVLGVKFIEDFTWDVEAYGLYLEELKALGKEIEIRISVYELTEDTKERIVSAANVRAAYEPEYIAERHTLESFGKLYRSWYYLNGSDLVAKLSYEEEQNSFFICGEVYEFMHDLNSNLFVNTKGGWIQEHSYLFEFIAAERSIVHA